MPCTSRRDGAARARRRVRHLASRGGARLLAILLLAVGAAGCSRNHSTVNPFGPDAGRISALSWFMISLASLITLGVFVLMIVGLFRDGTKRAREAKEHRLVLFGGVVMPVIVLLTLSGLTVFTLNVGEQSGSFPIEVIGHQWWWEVKYPTAHAETANEIHIPVGREVRFTLRAQDVIHSFWVPSLAGKTDMIPGRTNHLELKADKPGRYRGQCAEFCGLQHANMAFVVIAQPPSEFQRWLRRQAQPAASVSGQAATGKRTFEDQACAGCHTVRGTSAHGTYGPDLTHLQDRSTIAALTLPNRRGPLEDWIRNAPHIKPGVRMPSIPLTNKQAQDIVAYLEQLR